MQASDTSNKTLKMANDSMRTRASKIEGELRETCMELRKALAAKDHQIKVCPWMQPRGQFAWYEQMVVAVFTGTDGHRWL